MYCKEIKPVNPEGNQSWIFIGRTHAEAEAPIPWPPKVKKWLTGKDPDAGKDWRQEEKGTTEDDIVGWHHWLDGLEFEQALGVSDGQGRLACCSPWGCKESDTIEWLNWTDVCVHKRCHPGSDYMRGEARAWQLSLEQCQEWLQVGGRKRGLKALWPWFRQTLWGKLPSH